MEQGPNRVVNQVQPDVSRESSVCQTVFESLAEAEEIEPTELTPPLYEVIDPDALESLFATNQALGKVIFNYNGFEVSVFSDGHVSVSPHGT